MDKSFCADTNVTVTIEVHDQNNEYTNVTIEISQR